MAPPWTVSNFPQYSTAWCAACRYLPNHLGWLYGRDGNRISTLDGFLRASLRIGEKSLSGE
jgi:hypothetical protein